MHIYIYMHKWIQTKVHDYVYIYMHTCIHTYIHTCLHKCINTYTHTYIHGQLNTQPDSMCVHVRVRVWAFLGLSLPSFYHSYYSPHKHSTFHHLRHNHIHPYCCLLPLSSPSPSLSTPNTKGRIYRNHSGNQLIGWPLSTQAASQPRVTIMIRSRQSWCRVPQRLIGF